MSSLVIKVIHIGQDDETIQNKTLMKIMIFKEEPYIKVALK